MLLKRFLVVAVGGVLLICATFQWWHLQHAEAGGTKLGSFRLPLNVRCEVRDLPVAMTEAGSMAVANTLRYDDVIYREYRGTLATFALFAAYWSPGKLATQLVAAHTPDRCWPSAGWIPVKLEKRLPTELEVKGGQQRIFEAQGQMQHVVFWHFVGNEVYENDGSTTTFYAAWRWWRDAITQTFRSPPEQYFIRISSPQPLDVVREEPALAAVLAQVKELRRAREFRDSSKPRN